MHNKVADKNSQQCHELASRFSKNEELWQRYRNLVEGVEGVDVDAEFLSRPVRNYINFVSNELRDWFCQNSTDLKEDEASFDLFHRLIEKTVKV